MNETHIELLLRKAPRPLAPANLQRQLLAGIHLPSSQNISPVAISTAPFLRRWFPALSFGLLFLGCLVVLGVQTRLLLGLRRDNQELRAATTNLEQLRRENAELQKLRAASQEAEQRRRDAEELLLLRSEVSRLRSGVQELTTLRAEHQRLQAERAAAATKAGIAPEEDPLGEAKEKAERVNCISNLKQIGLAARIWANGHPTVDRRNLLPADFLTMSNELNTPKILTCSGDPARTRSASWQDFDGSSVSYELLSPGADERDPWVVYVRCPIHNNVGLADGSAQMLGEGLGVQKVDGKFKVLRLQTAVPKPAQP